MPFIAILIDALTFGAYFLQLHTDNHTWRFIGLILQGILTIFLLLLVIVYHGKRYSNYRPKGYSYLTIRFAIILFSFFMNAIVFFLYLLNFIGANNLIFSSF